MNSMIEYIRQINQTAVTLKPEWLDRLRHVDAGTDATSLIPEVILAEPGERKIPKFRAGNWEPPITEVNRPESQNSFEQNQATVGAPIETAKATVQDISSQTTDQAVAQFADSQTSAIAESQDNLYEYYTSSISTTDPVKRTNGPFVEPPPATQVDPMAETKLTEEISISPEPITAAESTAQPANEQTLQETAEAIQALRDSMIPKSASKEPEPTAASNREMESTVKKVLASNLDAPAILDGIVRPTIMPLRPNATTDVFSKGEAVPLTNHDSSEVDDTQQEALLSSKVSHAPASTDSTSNHPPSQIVEIINGLEGSNLERLQQVDTVPEEEWAQYTKAQAANVSGPQNLIEVTIPKQVLETLAEKDAPVVQPQPATDAPAKNCPSVSFPNDKRGQRFDFKHTKKQKLINSITDQVIERFPADTNATIMLVSANRNVDVDGAASKIATCLASREVGDILLVDGNLESRQLTSVLGMVTQPGVADCCMNNLDASSHISETDNPQLSILGAGTADAASAADQCPIPTATHMSMRENFDYSIISGGIPGDPLTDAWAQVVDGVYLLVDMDESDRPNTVAAVDYFRQLGARLVGCIASRS